MMLILSKGDDVRSEHRPMLSHLVTGGMGINGLKLDKCFREIIT